MKIGITYTGNEEKHNNYVNWISGKDKEIVVVTLKEDLNNILEVASCDGIVLSGGIDIAPEFYGAKSGYPFEPKQFNNSRDIFELNVFRESLQYEIPVLGICRGMQLVNCFYGGTLVQDLDEKNETHKITEVVDKVHSIKAVADGYIKTLIGDENVLVNSAHHQCIDRIGVGLYFSAYSNDEVPEAMERVDKEKDPFLLCVQWHPERMFSSNLEKTPGENKLRDTFIKAIINNK